MRLALTLALAIFAFTCDAADAAPHDIEEMLQVLASSGARVQIDSKRYIPEVELSLRINGEAAVARRYPSEHVAMCAASATPGSMLSDRWVFLKNSLTPTLSNETTSLAVAGAFALQPPDHLYRLDTAAWRLQHLVLPAQMNFSAGGYHDFDTDQVGEYGFLSEMSGGPILDGREQDYTLQFLPSEFNAEIPVIDGYCYQMWVPDGFGRWISNPKDDIPLGQRRFYEHQDRERYWVCFAYPADAQSGTMLAVLDGYHFQDSAVVYQAPFLGALPTPTDFFGDDYHAGAKPPWRSYEPGPSKLAWINLRNRTDQISLAVAVVAVGAVIALAIRAHRRRRRDRAPQL